jgi:hypothetical protein
MVAFRTREAAPAGHSLPSPIDDGRVGLSQTCELTDNLRTAPNIHGRGPIHPDAHATPDDATHPHATPCALAIRNTREARSPAPASSAQRRCKPRGPAQRRKAKRGAPLALRLRRSTPSQLQRMRPQQAVSSITPWFDDSVEPPKMGKIRLTTCSSARTHVQRRRVTWQRLHGCADAGRRFRRRSRSRFRRA